MILKTPLPPTALRLMLSQLHGEQRGRLTAAQHKHLNTQGLLDAGLLVPDAYATAYYCDSCFDFGDVHWREHPKTGEVDAVYRCRCGINRIASDELRTWSVVVPTLIGRIAEAMGFTTPPVEVIPNCVWSFGRKFRREFYLITGATPNEKLAVKALLAPHPTAVLLAATMAAEYIVNDLLPDHLAFGMESLATLDDSCRLSVNMEPILAELEPVEEEPKRQRAKRGNRAANIEKLVAEMKEHYRASRDHYYATGQLLPRPTQGELAKRIGTRQDDVSRCLTDPDAVMLKLLWSQAEDIRAVLNS